MAFRNDNPGPEAGFKGCVFISGGFRINGTSDPDALWDGNSNAVLSVVRDSEGIFTVTLNKPYPREMVFGDAALHIDAADVTDNDAYIVRDSYSSETGAFKIIVKEDGAGDGAGEVSDPEDNDVITFFLVMQKYDILVESHGS